MTLPECPHCGAPVEGYQIWAVIRRRGGGERQARIHPGCVEPLELKGEYRILESALTSGGVTTVER